MTQDRERWRGLALSPTLDRALGARMSSYREAFQNRCHVSIPRTRHQLAVPPSRVVVTDVHAEPQILFDSAAPDAVTVDVVVRIDLDDATVDLTFAVPQSGEVWLYEED